MGIHVALYHHTHYQYARPVTLSPQIVRLRPAPHCRTPIHSYSLRVTPADHFENWQQDPHGNFLLRLVFPEQVREFSITVDVVAEMTVINPFDFFIEEYAEQHPFRYEAWLADELTPYLAPRESGPLLSAYLDTIDRRPRNTVDFLVELNQQLQEYVKYLIRMEPGVQSCEETLRLRSGSCRDSAWLLAQILRHLGFASRFVSGYLIQLAPDVKSLDGPSGPPADFTDLHAWTEVYLPGAGWVGLDPTSGLLAGEGHIPVACTPDPVGAAPVTGVVEPCESTFHFEMHVTRIREEPRVTKPYTDSQWHDILAVGRQVDERLRADDVRLTMGGEPTFVSIDDMDGAPWNTEALGECKLALADHLIRRLQARHAAGGLLHFGQGKWYPGESLPRWALSCYWREDGEPLWEDPQWISRAGHDYGWTHRHAESFASTLAQQLAVHTQWVIPAYEDVQHYVSEEQRLPVNVSPEDPRLADPEARARMAEVFRRGLGVPRGFVLPLRRQWWQAQAAWVSGPWPLRTGVLFLLPGDSPIGFRLPLESLPWVPESQASHPVPLDPTAPRSPLPPRDGRRAQPNPVPASGSVSIVQQRPQIAEIAGAASAPAEVVRTAVCVEPRHGQLRVFLPPVERLEDYLDLVQALERTARQLEMPITLEGYLPPSDHRVRHFKITPDPGVLEVNTPPAHSWDELVDTTTTLYDEARQARLGTEKFALDGRHTGTGGGNHVVLGGPTPLDSPFLRRPDLLGSLVAYWNNHPALSYVFSGLFVGPTSQAPRVDEGRQDALYELELALQQVSDHPEDATIPPWLVDRIFRNLLVDVSGNTHRAEFCIDKLYSPDSAAGRLGLVEFRAFEMPPHARMSLAQQLLLRCLVARFWRAPYREPLVSWGTALHDRFLLPRFVWQDFCEVIEETCRHGFDLRADWFAVHHEFRFPCLGSVEHRGIELELRQAIEPWYVLGEEPGGGGTVRYVDSSVERLQVLVRGWTDGRYVVTCNRRQVPLASTGTVGEFAAGVRYRAWQPPHCLHPTIPIDAPLVFDMVDTWNGRSVGGCTYHVAHPGGRNYTTFPVNAFEAEARRMARFFTTGHSGGPVSTPVGEPNPQFPLTLDLRRGKRTA